MAEIPDFKTGEETRMSHTWHTRLVVVAFVCIAAAAAIGATVLGAFLSRVVHALSVALS